MELKTLYIEIMNPKLKTKLEMRKKENKENLSSVELEISTGEKKRLFIVSKEEVEALIDNEDHRKAFKIFGLIGNEKLPSRIKKKFFKNVFMNK